MRGLRMICGRRLELTTGDGGRPFDISASPSFPVSFFFGQGEWHDCLNMALFLCRRNGFRD